MQKPHLLYPEQPYQVFANSLLWLPAFDHRHGDQIQKTSQWFNIGRFERTSNLLHCADEEKNYKAYIPAEHGENRQQLLLILSASLLQDADAQMCVPNFHSLSLRGLFHFFHHWAVELSSQTHCPLLAGCWLSAVLPSTPPASAKKKLSSTCKPAWKISVYNYNSNKRTTTRPLILTL